METTSLHGRLAHCGGTAALAVLALAWLAPAALAETTLTLHSFAGGQDGQFPNAGVVLDSAGNVFGTTAGGGKDNFGTLFKVSATGAYRVLHHFIGSDGKFPFATLVKDAHGVLYGTAYAGGANGFGVVFSLNHGTLKVLYSFGGGNDGKFPAAGVVLDAAGNLYGTTAYGGAYGAGTVFQLNAAGTEKVLYSFHGTMDGDTPVGAPVLDDAGNLYGVTSGGGTAGLGAVFRVAPDGTETVLHSFTGGEHDGAMPYGALVRDKEGTLYGTTTAGVYNIGGFGPGSGSIFKITSDGTESLLYGFCATGDCGDGTNPYGGVVLGHDGMVYGVAAGGWAFGVLYGVNTATLQETPLNYFTNNQVNGLSIPNIGAQPTGPLALSGAGSLYGTTLGGGTTSGNDRYGLGTVYVVTP